MRDIGNDETEVLLAEIEKRIGREYKRAAEDIEAKLNDYWRRFQIKDEAWQRMVANGTKTKQQYQQWRTGQLMVGDRWEGMKKTIANDLHNANAIAKGIVNGNLAEVYAANHNFTTFDIEKAAGVNTSFTLVDRDTVNRIIRDNPELLPPPSATLQKEFADFDAYKAGKSVDLSEEKRKAFDKLIADNKDIRWQEGKIQSVTLQAILQGESIPNMAKRIAQELGETNHKSTIRYARTAVTGAQNAGKEDAYRRAEAHGCKMKRVWRAVHDNRTRHEHRVLDGQIRGIDEPFEIDGYKIDFPADPKLAREAPYLYWNCRCYTRALIDGLEPQAVKYRPETIDGMTYDEWLNAKPKSRSITHQEEVAENMRRRTIRELYGGNAGGTKTGGATGATKPPTTFAEKVNAIKKELENGGDYDDCINRAGKLMADEYKKHATEVEKATSGIQAQMEKLRQERNVLSDEYDRLLWRPNLTDAEKAADRARRQQLAVEIDKYNSELSKLRKQKDNISGKEAQANWLKGKLGEIRDVGIGNNDIKAHLSNGRSPMVAVVTKAYDYYPADWVTKSVARGTLRTGTVKRGYYNDWLGEIMISGNPKRVESFETALHELGHRFEIAVDGVLGSETRFYARRTAGEQLEWMGTGYDRSEMTRKDTFLHKYMGKDYGGSAYELVSMGFQMAYTKPDALAGDADMQKWIYGMLSIG